MPYKDPKKQKQWNKDYRKKNKDKLDKRSADWRRNNHKRFLTKLNDWRERNKQRIRDASNRYHRKLKMIVIIHYGGDPPKCACCGETNIEFLSIDHVNGGGNAHRRQLKTRNGWAFYLWLIKNNYPEGYQVLCFNCNLSKGFYGYCPHQTCKHYDREEINLGLDGKTPPVLRCKICGLYLDRK